jgi:hypothetical protein
MHTATKTKRLERFRYLPRSPKSKDGERNYNCINYNKCLTEAAINNLTFDCSNCEDMIEQSFNDLLKQERTTGKEERPIIPNKSLQNKKK